MKTTQERQALWSLERRCVDGMEKDTQLKFPIAKAKVVRSVIYGVRQAHPGREYEQENLGRHTLVRRLK